MICIYHKSSEPFPKKEDRLKRKVLFGYLVVITFSFLFSACNSSKVMMASERGIMYAMIYDYENIAVGGVTVKVNGKELVKSDVQGRFILDFKKRGEYEIELIKKGYEVLRQKFEYNPMDVLYFKMITAEQLVVLAEGEMDKSSYKEAEEYLERAYKLEPLRADIMYLRSISLVLQEKYIEAKKVLEELREKGYRSKYIDLLEEKIEKENNDGAV
jgi:tetratricopeptide (TPR) repeat protein